MSLGKLLNPSEVAEILGIARNTLAVWRCKGNPDLPYIKVGRKVMYHPHTVEQFIRVQTAGQPRDEEG